VSEDDELYTAYLKVYAKVRSGAAVDWSDHRSTKSKALWDTPRLGCVVAVAADDVKKGQPPRARPDLLADLGRMLGG
jgi:hypothetical protein